MSSEEPLDFSIKALKMEHLPDSEPTYIFGNYPYPVPVMPYCYPSTGFYPIPVPRLSYGSHSSDHKNKELQATSTSTSPTLYQYRSESEPNLTPSSERSYERKSIEVTSTMISPTYTNGAPNATHQEDHQIPDVMADVDILAEDPEYLDFETDAFRVMAERNGGSLLGSNPRMRRLVGTSNQTAPDDSYRTQRVKNNLAAKQSRDRRKIREMQLAFKVTYLSNKLSRLQQVLSTRKCARCQQRCDTK